MLIFVKFFLFLFEINGTLYLENIKKDDRFYGPVEKRKIKETSRNDIKFSDNYKITFEDRDFSLDNSDFQKSGKFLDVGYFRSDYNGKEKMKRNANSYKKSNLVSLDTIKDTVSFDGPKNNLVNKFKEKKYSKFSDQEPDFSVSVVYPKQLNISQVVKNDYPHNNIHFEEIIPSRPARFVKNKNSLKSNISKELAHFNKYFPKENNTHNNLKKIQIKRNLKSDFFPCYEQKCKQTHFNEENILNNKKLLYSNSKKYCNKDSEKNLKKNPEKNTIRILEKYSRKNLEKNPSRNLEKIPEKILKNYKILRNPTNLGISKIQKNRSLIEREIKKGSKIDQYDTENQNISELETKKKSNENNVRIVENSDFFQHPAHLFFSTDTVKSNTEVQKDITKKGQNIQPESENINSRVKDDLENLIPISNQNIIVNHEAKSRKKRSGILSSKCQGRCQLLNCDRLDIDAFREIYSVYEQVDSLCVLFSHDIFKILRYIFYNLRLVPDRNFFFGEFHLREKQMLLEDLESLFILLQRIKIIREDRDFGEISNWLKNFYEKALDVLQDGEIITLSESSNMIIFASWNKLNIFVLNHISKLESKLSSMIFSVNFNQIKYNTPDNFVFCVRPLMVPDLSSYSFSNFPLSQNLNLFFKSDRFNEQIDRKMNKIYLESYNSENIDYILISNNSHTNISGYKEFKDWPENLKTSFIRNFNSKKMQSLMIYSFDKKQISLNEFSFLFRIFKYHVTDIFNGTLANEQTGKFYLKDEVEYKDFLSTKFQSSNINFSFHEFDLHYTYKPENKNLIRKMKVYHRNTDKGAIIHIFTDPKNFCQYWQLKFQFFKTENDFKNIQLEIIHYWFENMNDPLSNSEGKKINFQIYQKSLNDVPQISLNEALQVIQIPEMQIFYRKILNTDFYKDSQNKQINEILKTSDINFNLFYDINDKFKKQFFKINQNVGAGNTSAISEFALTLLSLPDVSRYHLNEKNPSFLSDTLKKIHSKENNVAEKLIAHMEFVLNIFGDNFASSFPKNYVPLITSKILASTIIKTDFTIHQCQCTLKKNIKTYHIITNEMVESDFIDGMRRFFQKNVENKNYFDEKIYHLYLNQKPDYLLMCFLKEIRARDKPISVKYGLKFYNCLYLYFNPFDNDLVNSFNDIKSKIENNDKKSYEYIEDAQKREITVSAEKILIYRKIPLNSSL